MGGAAGLVLSAVIPISAGCSSSARLMPAPSAPNPAAVARAASPLGTYIKHVVIVVQENRSFENIFAGFPGADAPLRGSMNDGTPVLLTTTTFNGPDLPHGWSASILDWNRGKMNGFNLPTQNGRPMGARPYEYLKRSLVAPYWAMAQQYVLADRMFPTEFGASFTSHFDLVAATANLTPTLAEADNPSAYPWGCDAPSGTYTFTINTSRVLKPDGPFPCFNQFRTLADTLDAAKITWKYYENNQEYWSAFDAVHNVREGADWNRNVIEPQTTVLTDAAGGNLASVSWVVPDVADSDHPSSNSNTGPSWVASIVNAVGKSRDWKTTAIIVVWDDWGGWYDNVRPPQLDFVGLGIRVPCIIISPYAKRRYVSHTQYEFGSVVKFVEQVFGLPALGPRSFGYTDSRANSLVDSFDFSQKARAFRKIPAPYPASFFLERKESTEINPDPE